MPGRLAHVLQNVGPGASISLCTRPWSTRLAISARERLLGAQLPPPPPPPPPSPSPSPWLSMDLLKLPRVLWRLGTRSVRDTAPEFYDALAVLQRVTMPAVPLTTCMNYGWSPIREPDRPAPALAGHAQRSCLQLYDAVVRAAASRSFDASVQDGVGSFDGGLPRGADVFFSTPRSMPKKKRARPPSRSSRRGAGTRRTRAASTSPSRPPTRCRRRTRAPTS